MNLNVLFVLAFQQTVKSVPHVMHYSVKDACRNSKSKHMEIPNVPIADSQVSLKRSIEN